MLSTALNGGGWVGGRLEAAHAGIGWLAAGLAGVGAAIRMSAPHADPDETSSRKTGCPRRSDAGEISRDGRGQGRGGCAFNP